MRSSRRLLGMLLLACAVAACDDEQGFLEPTPPGPPVTETFTGAITANGAATHTFTTSTSGTITATLRTIGADNTLVVSFAIGNWTGSACSVVLASDTATGGHVLTGTMTGAGTLCARISDVGNIPAGQSAPYTVEVVHPQ